MTINFPNSPSLNQLYTYDNKTWEWNGVYWEVYSALTSYITSAYTVGNGFSDISGVTGGNIVLKSFSGVNINIIDSGNKLTFSGQSTSGFTSGTGTTNNLPKWITSNSLGDSIVSDNGSRMTVNGDSVIDNRYLGSRGGGDSFLFYGYNAGEGIDINYSNNIGIGSGVLKNSVGGNNIAIGVGLSDYPTENNILIGFNSFNNNSSGQYNIIIGNDSFQSNDSGTDNIAIGTNNLVNNTLGINNIAIGSSSVAANRRGNNNIGIGQSSLRNNIDSDNNIAIGTDSLLSNDTGYENISIGTQSLVNNSNGFRNIAIGTNALENNINGRQNIAIGTNLNSVTTGRRNIALGDDSLRSADNNDNIGIGVSSLYSIDSGAGLNISIGTSSLFSNQRGSQNVSIGYESGYNNNGNGNIFIGYRSAYDFTSSNRLYINNDSGIPLVYGEFNNKRFGINITAATNTLHVSGATNPLRLEGLQLSANTRYLVANDQGVVTFVTGVTSEKSFTNVAINGTIQLSASTNGTINFSGVNISITSASTNTLVFSGANNLDRINVDSIFGGGEDGDLDLTSSILTLTRDSFYNTINLNATGIIVTSNWRLFCRQLNFKGLGAVVRNNGTSGSNSPSGSGGGLGAGAPAGGFLAAGQSGTAGAAGVNQSNGVQSISLNTLALSTQFSVSGPSGKGGNTALRTGGATGGSNTVTNIKYISTIPFVDTLLRITTQVNGGAGGRGGSSGASDVVGTAGRGGGGGGGGAGSIIVFAETIDVSSATAPVFSAVGGRGGNGGTTAIADIAGGGGGSGGVGGYIVIVYKEIIGSLSGAVVASGGDGGNGGNGGVSGAAITGGDGGGSGGGGRIVLINVSTGLVTHVIGSNGVAGSAATGTTGALGATATPVTSNL